MKTLLQVLSEAERHQIHEATLKVLAETGVRVDTAQGRRFLKEAGAKVDENTDIVRFPEALVEESLRLAPKDFTLGARRPEWELYMNGGDCTLLADGEAVFVLDTKTGERRLGDYDDWLRATRLIDAIDEIGVYWCMVRRSEEEETISDQVWYWRDLFSNFSKHVQDAIPSAEYAPWLLEVLQAVFGDRETIRQEHPISFLLCPQSPLVIEAPYTDAYLALLGYDIPVACMPMPIMGATAPASLISTIVLGNAETLAMLCLIQAAAPGTPFIYAPVMAVMDPYTGRYIGGAIEQGLLGAAVTEMGRYYSLPVEASGIGTSHHVPGTQAGYERALTGILPALSWPDILVGAGLLGSAMNLSFSQIVIDVEIFRIFKRTSTGIASDRYRWLGHVIDRVGPGGHFLKERSTRAGVRRGEWFISDIGMQYTFEAWDAAGRPTLVDEARKAANEILEKHKPLPLDDTVVRELERIQRAADRATERR
jgi:trimethylamine--corrinoid protein Co-methyltransferase